ncbi:hypothetical protein NDU88_000697 [Pleurodeles waltl]|uniref:Uncharacterized protein n=1 Tax=Pleurodeles waltl TaxID=8319 RepID=A0AAV7LJ98_PLEWA|nr:hypothetical protein NDU88_000697 [Pleurodeles waltl]
MAAAVPGRSNAVADCLSRFPQNETKEDNAFHELLENEVISTVTGYMTVDFGSIKEEEWMDCVKSDHILQEVKRYVSYGWPSRGMVAAELEPFAKVRDELEVENEMLFKKKVHSSQRFDADHLECSS